MYTYLAIELTPGEKDTIDSFCKLFKLKFKDKTSNHGIIKYTFYFLSDYTTISYPSISSMVEAINKENNKYD